ncbi:MAG: TonB family protein [Candidatus Sulfotelmatobacter sp.]
MGLQCFLFTSDEGIAGTIRLVLSGLDVQGESCSEAVTAAERIANQAFQIVIIDWDNQPEAGLLLTTARQRKASERPITLAIVSDDASVPKALQAGANSILRKPIVVNQVKDTLMTARDLLRSKREPGAAPIAAKQAAAAGASAGPAPAVRTSLDLGKDTTLRAGEFLHSATNAPGGSFETDSDVAASMHEAAPEPADPLKDLEPVASSVTERKLVAPEPPTPNADEPRGLEWHLKNRGIARPSPIEPNSSAASAATAPARAPEKPELLGYEATPSPSQATEGAEEKTPAAPIQSYLKSVTEQKKEAVLFSYIEGGEAVKEQAPKRSFRLGKGTIATLVVVVVCAIAAVPQAPWHPQMQVLWSRGQRVLHVWLNPQPVTPAPAPVSHENFARAGDEYKLPAAEAIPDATTDPSQIQVVPVVDPTKKPTGDAANATTTPADGTTTTPADQSQVPAPQTPDAQPAQSPAQSQPKDPAASASMTVAEPAVVTTAAPEHADSPAPLPALAASAPAPAPVKPQPVRAPSIPDHIPSSLKSQLATTTPELSGSKSPDTAMQSIEPVAVAEGAERALLIEQPAIAYPVNSRNLQGTVILQVLIGRDGTVQDAKFLQGSLAFARTAIDGVKQWKFKPYTMNGRPVSVQTLLSLTFKPGS